MRKLLTRRALLSTGLVAAALPLRSLAARAEACILLPEQDLGPYYLPNELVRSDIRDGKAGVRLDLRIQVLDVDTCQPIAGAAVDLWHCDALGVYSGFSRIGPLVADAPPAPPPGSPGQAPAAQPTDHLTFLRGIQLTDARGIAHFRTILPGCYPGRTNHMHFKVRMAGAVEARTYQGGHVAHTGQIFFPEHIVAPLMEVGAYALHPVERTALTQDRIFASENGRASLARMKPLLEGSRGFEAALVAGVDPKGRATPA